MHVSCPLQNDAAGMKNVHLSSRLYIDGADAAVISEGEIVTFINWGNLRINKIHRDGDRITSVDAELNLDNTVRLLGMFVTKILLPNKSA